MNLLSTGVIAAALVFTTLGAPASANPKMGGGGNGGGGGIGNAVGAAAGIAGALLGGKRGGGRRGGGRRGGGDDDDDGGGSPPAHGGEPDPYAAGGGSWIITNITNPLCQSIGAPPPAGVSPTVHGLHQLIFATGALPVIAITGAAGVAEIEARHLLGGHHPILNGLGNGLPQH